MTSHTTEFREGFGTTGYGLYDYVRTDHVKMIMSIQYSIHQVRDQFRLVVVKDFHAVHLNMIQNADHTDACHLNHQTGYLTI